jgi:hypothetical protein
MGLFKSYDYTVFINTFLLGRLFLQRHQCSESQQYKPKRAESKAVNMLEKQYSVAATKPFPKRVESQLKWQKHGCFVLVLLFWERAWLPRRSIVFPAWPKRAESKAVNMLEKQYSVAATKPFPKRVKPKQNNNNYNISS